MHADAQGTQLISPDPEAIPHTDFGYSGDEAMLPAPNTARAREAAARSDGTETPAAHLRRKAVRGRFHAGAIVTVALVAVLIVLAASNTAQVGVHWLIGTSHVSLFWLVLVTGMLGWALGLVTGARFHWRTRAPRRHARART